MPLPRGEGGLRLFDDTRGNKKYKHDLEVCVAGGGALFALGSGSSEHRQSIVRLDQAGDITVTEAPALYESLRERVRPLNLEGAVVLGDTLRLFNRGDNATIDIDFLAFASYLGGGPLPALISVERYELGSAGAIRYGFTDAALVAALVLYSAAAEATDDPVLDGPVHGSAIGVLASEPRWVTIADFDGKIEGIAPAEEPHRLWCLVDRDDPDRPSDLCLVRLDGDWFSGG